MICIKICAWCKKEIESSDDSEILSHGICKECSNKMMTETINVKKVINEFKIPVLVVNRDVYIESANPQAEDLFDFDIKKVKHNICGDVINCVNVDLPNGCGETEFCPSCEIRNAVEETFKTGNPQKKILTNLKIKTKSGIKEMQLLISTSFFGKNILLEINKIMNIKDYEE